MLVENTLAEIRPPVLWRFEARVELVEHLFDFETIGHEFDNPFGAVVTISERCFDLFGGVVFHRDAKRARVSHACIARCNSG